MHLKACPKLVHSELRLDASGAQQSGLFVSQQGALLRTCSSNHGNSPRLPLSVISTNTLCCGGATNHGVGSSVASLRLKVSPGSPLQLVPPMVGCENSTLRLCPPTLEVTPEVADASLDIWTVIKPGHVREKIAIFAPDGQSSASSGERTPTSGSGSRERTASACQSHTPSSGPLRAAKAKGSREENCSAKRRRRSGNAIQQDQRGQEPQQPTHRTSPWRPEVTQQLGREASEEEGEEQKVSVVEMVAFLEQRANETQPDTKPLLTLQRSSASITLSRAPARELKDPANIREEEPESIRVSDMVARLEWECQQRRTEGGLSRSNSLRRSVGRVLLAAAEHGPAPVEHSPAPCQSAVMSSSVMSSSVTTQVVSSVMSLPASREPISCFGTPPTSAGTPPSSTCQATPPPGESRVATMTVPKTEAPPPSQNLSQSKEAEPPPGLLFMSPEPRPSLDYAPLSTDSQPHSHDSNSLPEQRRSCERAVLSATGCSLAKVSVGRRASVSQDFLLMRQRLQQLLEPRPYLTVLPHHVLVKIFLFLPTQSLAALKCTCQYFHFIIDTYGVRPADSLWVSDPRYRDDPCKQCKKRYGRGDVSLCRWHHKPYCQALPYGPGYWMCCHGAHRDTPGCNVGLHDNRWVPVFHSINVPIYRRGRHDD